MFLPGRTVKKGSGRRKTQRKAAFFELTDEALEHFKNIGHRVSHPAGSVVFREGDVPGGIYLIYSGEVKLFATAPDGRTMILKIANPGDVLGLSAMLTELPYEVTAKTLGPCDFKQIGRTAFLTFLEAYAQAGYTTALTLAKEHREVFFSARRLGLSPSVPSRIAQILLGFAQSDKRERAPSFRMMLNHGELASLAGTSRETATRLLNQLERDGVIARANAIITILRLRQLEQLAH